MAGLRIIRLDALEKAPQAVQDYVKQWFRPGKVLGIPVMMASTTLGAGRPGVAPRHNEDTREYTKGLKGSPLNEWWHSAERRGLVADISVDDHDARGSICVDD